MEQFWVIFWSAIGTAVTGLVTWATVTFTNWLNTKIKDKKLARWSSQVFEIIMNAVQSIQQTFVETMKKEGKFNAEAAKEAKEKAYSIITGQLTVELKDYISSNFGDMKEFIMNQIESMIYQLKNR